MSDNLNWSNTGEQIKTAVTEALQSGDFKELNHLVSQTVTNVVDEVGRHVSSINVGAQNKSQNTSGGFSDSRAGTAPRESAPPPNIPVWRQRAQEREMRRQQQQLERQRRQERQRPPAVSRIKFKRIGNVSNVLYQVFGGIGLGITGLVTLIRLIVLLTGGTSLAGWIANFIFLGIFFGMVRLGLGQRRRLKRAERYLQLCDYRVYGEIEHLAGGIGRSKSYVTKDLQRMIELGIFPEGHLDAQKTCFMLNDEVYRQYLEAENARRIRESESRRALETAEPSQTPQPQSATAEEQSELDVMVAEGMEYIRKLRDLNDRIPGEVISAKLFCLENLLKEIFDRVREHTEQMHRMHKLMSYYLPTTLKLVEAYEEFDRVSSPGEDIVKAKAEIENTLDTINQAFRELLNNLFQDAVLDATTDAQVLKTMLAKEGLTREMEFATLDRN